jgi:hypothetical protein
MILYRDAMHRSAISVPVILANPPMMMGTPMGPTAPAPTTP